MSLFVVPLSSSLMADRQGRQGCARCRLLVLLLAALGLGAPRVASAVRSMLGEEPWPYNAYSPRPLGNSSSAPGPAPLPAPDDAARSAGANRTTGVRAAAPAGGPHRGGALVETTWGLFCLTGCSEPCHTRVIEFVEEIENVGSSCAECQQYCADRATEHIEASIEDVHSAFATMIISSAMLTQLMSKELHEIFVKSQQNKTAVMMQTAGLQFDKTVVKATQSGKDGDVQFEVDFEWKKGLVWAKFGVSFQVSVIKDGKGKGMRLHGVQMGPSNQAMAAGLQQFLHNVARNVGGADHSDNTFLDRILKSQFMSKVKTDLEAGCIHDKFDITIPGLRVSPEGNLAVALAFTEVGHLRPSSADVPLSEPLDELTQKRDFTMGLFWSHSLPKVLMGKLKGAATSAALPGVLHVSQRAVDGTRSVLRNAHVVTDFLVGFMGKDDGWLHKMNNEWPQKLAHLNNQTDPKWVPELSTNEKTYTLGVGKEVSGSLTLIQFPDLGDSILRDIFGKQLEKWFPPKPKVDGDPERERPKVDGDPEHIVLNECEE